MQLFKILVIFSIFYENVSDSKKIKSFQRIISDILECKGQETSQYTEKEKRYS